MHIRKATKFQKSIFHSIINLVKSMSLAHAAENFAFFHLAFIPKGMDVCDFENRKRNSNMLQNQGSSRQATTKPCSKTKLNSSKLNYGLKEWK
jgi:hypothetical protein